MRWALLVLAAFGGLTASASAAAPVSFEDRGPLKRDLATLRDQGGVRVTVVNLRRSTQAITVSVGAVEPPQPALRALFGGAVTKDVGARRRQPFSIALRLPASATPPARTYTATIVAQGESGAIARRTFRLTVPAAAQEQQARLAADGLADLTLPAINFAPSLLSPLGPTMTVAGAVLLILTIIFWRTLRGLPRPLAIVAGSVLLAAGYRLLTYGRATHDAPALIQDGLFGLAVACVFAALVSKLPFRLRRAALGIAIGLFLAGALLETSGAHLEDQPAAHLVATKRIPLVPDAVTGTAGVVTDGEGEIAELEASQAGLEVVGLIRAGTYSGNLDLSPGEEGGAAKATVTVRDWWPWALLVLASGVAAGAWVRRYFDVVRPRQLVFGDFSEVLRRVNAPDQARGSGYGISRRAYSRGKEIERLLAAGEVDEAAKRVAELRKYLDGFRRADRRLMRLRAAARGLDIAHAEKGFGVAREHVEPLRQARRRLAAGDEFDTDDPDADEALLKTLIDDATKLSQLNEEALWVHEVIRSYLGERTDATLEGLGADALRASSVERLAEIKKEADDTHDTDDNAAERSAPARGTVLPSEEAVPRAKGTNLTATITFQRDGRDADGRDAQCSGRAGDLFKLEAKLTGDVVDNGLVTLSWDFDDGTDLVTQDVLLADGAATAAIWHAFARGGDRVVRLRHHRDEIGRVKMKLARQRPLEGRQARFVWRDREMTLVAGLLAAGSGMVTLYFADADWGGPKDYLQAALWGAVVAEGAKLVTDLVARTAAKG